MKKNETIRIQGSVHRVLFIKDDKILVINCMKPSMPVWIPVPEEYTVLSEEEYKLLYDRDVESIDDLDPERRKTAYYRFFMIAGIVAVINDKQLYTKQIGAVSGA